MDYWGLDEKKSIRPRSYEGLEAAPDRGEGLHTAPDRGEGLHPVPVPVPVPALPYQDVLASSRSPPSDFLPSAITKDSITTSEELLVTAQVGTLNALTVPTETATTTIVADPAIQSRVDGRSLYSGGTSSRSASRLRAGAGLGTFVPPPASYTNPYDYPRYFKPSLSRGSHLRKPTEKKLFGMSKPTFYLLISNLILLAITVFLSIWAGLNMTRSAAHPATATVTAACNATTTAPDHSFVTPADNPQICFNTTSPLSAGAAPGVPEVSCPLSSSELYYNVPGTNLTFRRTCDLDYTGSDMGQFPVRSMKDCIALCAQLNLYVSFYGGKCVAVSWVYGQEAQGIKLSYCYPKYSISTSVNVREYTESAAVI